LGSDIDTNTNTNTGRRRRKGYAKDAKKREEKIQKEFMNSQGNLLVFSLFGIPSA
jgi:hypothetical protein